MDSKGLEVGRVIEGFEGGVERDGVCFEVSGTNEVFLEFFISQDVEPRSKRKGHEFLADQSQRKGLSMKETREWMREVKWVRLEVGPQIWEVLWL